MPLAVSLRVNDVCVLGWPDNQPSIPCLLPMCDQLQWNPTTRMDMDGNGAQAKSTCANEKYVARDCTK